MSVDVSSESNPLTPASARRRRGSNAKRGKRRSAKRRRRKSVKKRRKKADFPSVVPFNEIPCGPWCAEMLSTHR